MSSKEQAGNFVESFREEAREILVDLEAALLELNASGNDTVLVGRVFRALHTIKGSGSMFGFDKLAEFTHNLENAFDQVRNGQLTITPELIDVTLSALDQIRAMLDESSGGKRADAEACAAIQAKLGTLMGSTAKAAGTEKVASATNSAVAEQRPREQWKIRFAPGPEALRTGADPMLLLRELDSMGELKIASSFEAVPPLQELDPERCYICWEMTLTTAAGLDAIRDVFLFVEDSSELTIEREAAEAVVAEAPESPADKIQNGLIDPRGKTCGRRDYDRADNATSLRVPAVKIDQFVDLVGEMVTVQARLTELAARSEDPEIASVSEEIERLTGALRESSMNIRMLPIRATFERFRRLVHDLARSLNKNVELTIAGAETELDKTVIEQLGDPLMHLIRNCMDHGVESPQIRAERGKPSTATIHLSARHAGASVLIEVSDDGGGIDAEAVRRRAVERGLVSADRSLTESEIYSLLFEPGFSTAPQVTDLSGRGVGMDVVRQHVESLHGTIEVNSQPGQGTSVMLRLPLTLAIIDGLLVKVDHAFFVLPLASTLECIELTSKHVADANGKHVAHVRGEIVSYIRLREHFGVESARPEIEQIMIVETEVGRYGLVVDEVLGECQTVIKSLGRYYRGVQIISGATILGNGTVALILDPHRLVQEALRAVSLEHRVNVKGRAPRVKKAAARSPDPMGSPRSRKEVQGAGTGD